MSNEMTSIVELSAQELDAVAGGSGSDSNIKLKIKHSLLTDDQFNLHSGTKATFDTDEIDCSTFNLG